MDGSVLSFLKGHGGQFYWWRKSKYPGKTIDLQQVVEKFIT
jgi:hypothetical protein